MDSATGGRKSSTLRIVVLSLCISPAIALLELALWYFLREVSREQAVRDTMHRWSQSHREATGFLLQR